MIDSYVLSYVCEGDMIHELIDVSDRGMYVHYVCEPLVI